MLKTCKLCGEQFEYNGNRKICFKQHYYTCKVCGKQYPINSTQFNVCCSKECSRKLRKQNAEATSLLRYGVKNAGYTKESQEKIKKTNLERFGTEYAFQSDTLKEKIRRSNLEKYGVDNPMKSKEIQEKAKATNIERYGAECVLGTGSKIREQINRESREKFGNAGGFGNTPEATSKRMKTNEERYGVPWVTQSPEVAEKRAETCRSRYGTSSPFESEIIQEKIRKVNLEKYGYEYPMRSEEVKKHMSESIKKKYGVDWACMLPQCMEAVGTRVSSFNRAFGKFLEDDGFTVEYEFPIGNKQYDIKVGRILIEIDPTYTHTTYEGVHSRFGAISKNYHVYKTDVAMAHGYRCIHVFDWDDWNTVLDYIKSEPSITVEDSTKKYVCDNAKEDYHRYVELGFRIEGQIGPREIWSKGSEAKFEVENKDELLKDGWLPIYDCGLTLLVR